MFTTVDGYPIERTPTIFNETSIPKILFKLSILEILPPQRQNIMFSATMTDDVDLFIQDFFKSPENISVAVSGTPLDNIDQVCYSVPNFYTKVNLLQYLLKDKQQFQKVLVFVPNKKSADLVFQLLEEKFNQDVAVIHSNKTQNYRIRSIESFNTGEVRVLVTSDVMSRGLDLNKITHVINFDTPLFPENYMHRIGRTGRAEEQGSSILLYTEKEQAYKEAIEKLMDYKIPKLALPEGVEISKELSPEEKPKHKEKDFTKHKKTEEERGAAFHEKKEKNQKENLGGSYRREIKKKYKKPKTRGSKK